MLPGEWDNMKLYPVHFCMCGCGFSANTGKRFVSGHNMKRGEVVFTKEHKQRISESLTGRVRSEEHKRNLSLSLKGRKVWNLGRKSTEEEKRKLSVAHKDQKWTTEARKNQMATWADPVRKDKRLQAMFSALHKSPNKPETELLKLLESIQPGDWKYVGDGSVIISGMNPDFINVNGKKLIIEMFGDYWHRNDSAEERAAVFKPSGFHTLVVWERELKDLCKLKKRINKFTGNHAIQN